MIGKNNLNNMKEIQGKPQNGLQLVSPTNGSHQVNGQVKKCVCNTKGKHKNINILLFRNLKNFIV